jgi:hypothetical protein
MLIAQARAEHLSLLTRDRAIIAYGEAGPDVVTFDGGELELAIGESNTRPLAVL